MGLVPERRGGCLSIGSDLLFLPKVCSVKLDMGGSTSVVCLYVCVYVGDVYVYVYVC